MDNIDLIIVFPIKKCSFFGITENQLITKLTLGYQPLFYMNVGLNKNPFCRKEQKSDLAKHYTDYDPDFSTSDTKPPTFPKSQIQLSDIANNFKLFL